VGLQGIFSRRQLKKNMIINKRKKLRRKRLKELDKFEL